MTIMQTLSLPRASAESQGISSSAIVSFLDAVEHAELGLHSFMLVRHGSVVAEGWWAPYSASEPHMLASLSKSFVSTAAGMAIEEGFFNIDDTVLKFFPDEAPAEISTNLAAMKVVHLLTMATGHDTEPDKDAVPDRPWVATFLAHPVKHAPGSHFLYNSLGTYTISAIIQKTTGKTVNDYLRPRLFEPLGIGDTVWEQSPQGIDAGGWGLYLRTEDIAKFGPLYLQKGEWCGKRLIAEEWIAQATSRQISNGSGSQNDWNQGYGYQFWRCRPGCYRGDGYAGQFSIVVPDQDAVVAITAGSHDIGAIMEQVWKTLLPAMKPSPLEPNRVAAERLAAYCRGLEITTPAGNAYTSMADHISGRRYILDENERGYKCVEFRIDASGSGAVTFVDKTDEQTIAFGGEGWKLSHARWIEQTPRNFGGRACWTQPDALSLTIVATEAPWVRELTARFKGDAIDLRLSCKIGETVDFSGRTS